MSFTLSSQIIALVAQSPNLSPAFYQNSTSSFTGDGLTFAHVWQQDGNKSVSLLLVVKLKVSAPEMLPITAVSQRWTRNLSLNFDRYLQKTVNFAVLLWLTLSLFITSWLFDRSRFLFQTRSQQFTLWGQYHYYWYE